LPINYQVGMVIPAGFKVRDIRVTAHECEYGVGEVVDVLAEPMEQDSRGL